MPSWGTRNAEVHVADGSTGWPEAAPYDGIMVTAAGPEVPEPLLAQLAPTGGRLVMPIGRHDDAQELLLVERDGAELRRRSLGPVRFVPLVGREGWAAVRENGHRAWESGEWEEWGGEARLFSLPTPHLLYPAGRSMTKYSISWS